MNITSILHTVAKVLSGALAGILAFFGSLHIGPVPPLLPAPAEPSAATTTGFPAAASTTQKAAMGAATSAKPAATAVSAQTSPSAPAQSPVAGLDSATLNTVARASLVNIMCTTIAGGSFKPISGSGVMVDGRGVVLTNAHVAQFFLLRDYGAPGNITCTIRTGSPAINAYTAKLLYLPPAWIDSNASQITSTQASGTGENDFAFLYITGPYNPSNTLPASLPHLAMSTAAPDIGDQMLLAAYPAGFLSGELIATQLYASSALAYVTQLFSFAGTSHVDLFSVGGSIESQAGSSGGAVLRQDGTLAGIISTAILKGSTSQRDLRAITVDYINRTLKSSGQGGIVDLLTGDLEQKAADFNTNIAPGETAKLEAVLNAQ